MKLLRTSILFTIAASLLLLPVSVTQAQDDPTPEATRPLPPGDTARTNPSDNPKLAAIVALLVVVTTLLLMTIGLFLVYFPKGYQDARREAQTMSTLDNDQTQIDETPAASPSEAPRVVFLNDDQS